MMMYVLIGLSLALAGVAGLQFFYMIYLERIDREQKRRIHELEHHCRHLSHRLNAAEQQVTEQSEMIESFFEDITDEEEEIWADVIEDR